MLMLNKLTRLLLLLSVLAYSHIAKAQVRPLLVIPLAEFSAMTEREKDFYVAGVLEGQSFLLYGKNDSDLAPFVECVNREGVTSIRKAAEMFATLDGVISPMPWFVAKAVGIICKKYR